MDTKLTDYELKALSSVYNLADGHARFMNNESFSNMIDFLKRGYVQIAKHELVEKEFLEAFAFLSGQKSLAKKLQVLYSPSASLSIEIVANYLRIKNTNTALVEPVFDNLADILKRHSVLSKAIKVPEYVNLGVINYLSKIDTSSFFFVIPNNPTGHIFEKNEFVQLVNYCKTHEKLLVLDFSFRFFCDDMSRWDQYEILEESKVRYIAIEDTGKTWPTFELKASAMLADPNTFSDLQRIYRDLFINLSPFVLGLLTHFLKSNDYTVASINKIITKNRVTLLNQIDATSLISENLPNGSVEWLRIVKPPSSDIEITEHLMKSGVLILPGKHFFWSENNLNTNYIRIALMRDEEYFREATDVLLRALNKIADENN